MSEEEAGRRLALVVSDPSYNTSCAYWSWNGTDKFTNQVRGRLFPLPLLGDR